MIDTPAAGQHQHQQNQAASGSTVAQPPASPASASQADADNAIQTPALNTHRPTPGKYHTRTKHDHQHNEPVSIPVEIQAYIEKQRIPASELSETHHPDGSVSIDLKGQYRHVPVAVIGDDGKLRIIETQIRPLSDQ